MRITARPMEGKPGQVEILVNGKKCEEIRCKNGSARVIGGGMIALTALITCPVEKGNKKKAKEEANNEDIYREEGRVDSAV